MSENLKFLSDVPFSNSATNFSNFDISNVLFDNKDSKLKQFVKEYPKSHAAQSKQISSTAKLFYSNCNLCSCLVMTIT